MLVEFNIMQIKKATFQNLGFVTSWLYDVSKIIAHFVQLRNWTHDRFRTKIYLP